MKTNITLLLAFGIICALLFGYGQYCSTTTPVKLVNIDSLEQIYQQERDSMAVNQFALEREIAVLSELRNLDQAALNKANLTLKQSNEKVKQLIAANRELSRNDTGALITNCNDLVVDAYNLTIAVDSLQTALKESEETNRALIEMQDIAIESANDAALKSHDFAMKFKAAADSANYQLSQVPKLQTREKRKAFYNGGLFGIAAGIIIGVVVTR